jgi:hypothetical protein
MGRTLELKRGKVELKERNWLYFSFLVIVRQHNIGREKVGKVTGGRDKEDFTLLRKFGYP